MYANVVIVACVRGVYMRIVVCGSCEFWYDASWFSIYSSVFFFTIYSAFSRSKIIRNPSFPAFPSVPPTAVATSSTSFNASARSSVTTLRV